MPQQFSAPKAFVSHSWDDKERFVLPFAQRLRAQGVDVWLDKWEMRPGDSLVDKIFSEGLAGADVFVAVVSKNSVNSRWVKEELNAATIKRIEGKCRVIPLILDDVAIPAPLETLIYHKVKDLDNWDEDFKIILNTIFNISDKPPMGAPPLYVQDRQAADAKASGLPEIDFFLLSQLFECSLERPNVIPESDPFIEAALKREWPRKEAEESVVALAEEGLIIGHGTLYQKNYPSNIRLSERGWIFMFQHTRPDYHEVMHKLAAHLVSIADGHEGKGGHEIAEYIGESSLFTLKLLDELELRGYIRLLKTMGPTYFVTSVSPKLKRALQGDTF